MAFVGHTVFADASGSVNTNNAMFKNLQGTAGTGGYQTNDVNQYSLSQIIGQVVGAFLGLLGIIFIILIIYSGYNWMTANGNEEKVDRAKDTLWRTLIGLIIIIGAYAIWNFVLNKLLYS